MIRLQQKLNYQFKNPELLKEALTHPSASKNNYERLEFFGDTVLSMVIGKYLITHFPHEREGHLAKRHAAIVSGKTAAEVAKSIDLGDALILSKGEEDSGGRETASNLEDALEALIGAIYLDSNIDNTQNIILNIWQPFLSLDNPPPKDPKSSLQEWLQKRGLPLPEYQLMEIEGSAHMPLFKMKLTIENLGEVNASCRSKKSAEQKLAKLMLEKIGKE